MTASAKHAPPSAPQYRKSIRASLACWGGGGIELLARRIRGLAIALGAITMLWGSAAHAYQAPEAAQPGPCHVAAVDAAHVTGVPLDVLRALALTESGRRRGGRLRAWPWTVNMAGTGHWFDSRDAAVAFVRERRAAGERSFDLGCFQLNHRWHGDSFSSIEQMFDPQQNALYAARFLSRLKAEFGTWEAAAGAYHSRTPELAERYIGRFRTRLATLTPADGAAPDAGPARRLDGAAQGAGTRTPANPYPLLKAGASGPLGSIVPGDVVATNGRFLQPAGRALR